MASSVLSPTKPPYLTLSITQALSLPEPTAPEPCHHHSINALIDARARCEPASQRASRPAVGFTELDPTTATWSCSTLSYPQLRSLGLAVAERIRARLPPSRTNARSPNGTPLVAVLSPSGVELFAHVLALWRLGYGVLCIAPGSPAEAIANLLRLTETEAVVAHQSQYRAAQEGVDQLQASEAARPASVVAMLEHISPLLSCPDQLDGPPSLDDRGPGPEDVLVTMHTSGSSGLPKPIYQPHRFWTQSMVTAAGTELAAFTTTPLFHGGMSDFLRSLQAGSSIYFHPSAAPGALTAKAIVQAAAACPEPISYFLSVPYILELLYTDQQGTGRSFLRPMQLVSTGGAPLPQPLGDAMVSDGIRLVSRLGSSECGFLMSSWRDFGMDREWSFLRVPDRLGQTWLRFEPVAADSYELIVDPAWPVKLVANRDDGSYATSDLYQPHETKPNTWKYAARSDDTLVLVSGKKATAPPLEAKLRSEELVAEAIAFGANRAILGVLVFLSTPANDAELTLERKRESLRALRPAVESYNRSASPHAQLAMEMVHLLPSSALAGIPRASKGSLQRGRAYQKYEPLIAQAYRDFEEGRSISIDTQLHAGDADGSGKRPLEGQALVDWLKEMIMRLRRDDSESDSRKTRPIADDTDLFVAGIDSIQAARIRAAIHQNIELGGRLLPQNVVYDFPTPRLLSDLVVETRHGSDAGKADSGQYGKTDEQQHQLMLDLVERYSRFDVPKVEMSTTAAAGTGTSDGAEAHTLYVLTGVTGALGAHLLDQVLARIRASPADAATVLCLVRADNDQHARTRILTSLKARRRPLAVETVQAGPDAVLCMASDLSRPDCSLASEAMERLRGGGRFTRIVTIHAAWAVNFVGSLQSFEAEQIAGLRHLIQLHREMVAASPRASRLPSASHFSFCSSVASVLGLPPSAEANTAVMGNGEEAAYAELLPSSPATAAPMGYARSKWVAEHICSRFSQRCREETGVSVLRIGQLCSDTENGIWNESEGWPLLVRTAEEVGCLPVLDEKLSWLPVDVAAASIVELVADRATTREPAEHDGMRIYNLVSDDTETDWQALLCWLGELIDFRRVAPSEWVEELERNEDRTKARGMLALWKRNYGRSSSSSSTEPTVPASAGRTRPARIDSSGARAGSGQLRTASRVDEALIRKSVAAWRASGFLSS